MGQSGHLLSVLLRLFHFIALALIPVQWRENHVCSGVSGPGEAPSPTGSVLALLESLQNAPHLEVHKDMISWILKVPAEEQQEEEEER